MATIDVQCSVRFWDLGQLGELHEVERGAGTCEIWIGERRGGTYHATGRCQGHIRYVWAQAGKADRCYCDRHGIDTFPEARNKPDGGRPRAEEV